MPFDVVVATTLINTYAIHHLYPNNTCSSCSHLWLSRLVIKRPTDLATTCKMKDIDEIEAWVLSRDPIRPSAVATLNPVCVSKYIKINLTSSSIHHPNKLHLPAFHHSSSLSNCPSFSAIENNSQPLLLSPASVLRDVSISSFLSTNNIPRGEG